METETMKWWRDSNDNVIGRRIRLSHSQIAKFNKSTSGQGGWQNLITALRNSINSDNWIELNHGMVVQTKLYGTKYGNSGGYQAIIKPLLDAFKIMDDEDRGQTTLG